MSLVFKRTVGAFYDVYDGDILSGNYTSLIPSDLGDQFVLYTDEENEAEYDDGFEAGREDAGE